MKINPLKKYSLLLNLYGWAKIPLLGFVGPQILELGEQRSRVKVKLGYRTRNHLGVMYFGALAIGAELSIALKAVEQIQKSKKNVAFLFKNFQCDFLKRVEGDVELICFENQALQELFDRCISEGQRVEGEFSGHAIVPTKGPEPVMTYKLTLSMKLKS